MDLRQNLAKYIDQHLETEEDPYERGSLYMSWKGVDYRNHPVHDNNSDQWQLNMALDIINFIKDDITR